MYTNTCPNIIFTQQGTHVPPSREKEAPRPAVIEHDDDEPLTNGYILADSRVLEINEAADLCDMLLLLMECYVWDLTYPTQYQILGILQIYLPKDTSSKFKKSFRFMKFEKHLSWSKSALIWYGKFSRS